MSDFSSRRIRLNTLAAATALILASAAAPAMAGRVNLAGLEQGSTDRFIVKYRSGLATSAVNSSLGVAASRAGMGATVQHVRKLAVGADLVRANRKLDPAEAESLMRQIAADPAVEYVEIDKVNHPVFTPNDSRFGEQYGFGTGAGGTYATQAWDITNGAGITVAVLDTGIVSHSDLNANIIGGYDFIIDTAVAADGNGRDSNPADPGDASGGQSSSWHGTHVAGTIGAVTNNGAGVAGMAYGAKVVPIRVLGKGGGYDSDIADAMIWAAGGTVAGVPANANPAQVINLSLGGTGACSTTSQNAINSAVSRGATIVIAAGNSNANVSGFSPGNCANIVSVASTTNTGARSSFSNYGSLIDIAAPGSAILSTLNSGTAGPAAESYASYSGTSMAAPHVAGIVALMQAVSSPRKTPAQIESILKSTARAFPATPSQPIGPGIAQARAAVDSARGGATPPPPPPPTGGAQTYTNSADYQIRDNSTVESPIAVSGRTGNAPSNASVSVNIVHTYRGDMLVQLVAPDGSLYTISNRAGGSADNLVGTYTANLSTELLNGTWKLRVNDNAAGDIGYINSWSITF